MNRFFTVFFVFFSLVLTQCQSREDRELDKAIFNYVYFCPAGSPEACKEDCAERYPNVTGENFSEVDSCISACNTNCSITNILLLLETRK